jgi:hypothetical protein
MGRQIALEMTIVNQTKRTTLSGEGKIQLIELEPNGVVLEVPADTCAQGQVVVLKVRTKGLPAEVELEIPAKVAQQSFEARKSATESVTLRFGKYDEKAWERVVSLFQGRQDDLLRVFRALKE